MIEIINLRVEKPSEPYDVIVDRRSPLGNPFYLMDETERDKVCDMYEERFSKAKYTQLLWNELQRLRSLHEEYGQLRLFCWCVPKRCHAETIKRYLENLHV